MSTLVDSRPTKSGIRLLAVQLYAATSSGYSYLVHAQLVIWSSTSAVEIMQMHFCARMMWLDEKPQAVG